MYFYYALCFPPWVWANAALQNAPAPYPLVTQRVGKGVEHALAENPLKASVENIKTHLHT